MKIKKIYMIVIIPMILFASYRFYKVKGNGKIETNTTELVPSISEIIKIDSEVLNDVNLHSVQITPSEFQETIHLIGEVQADPDRVTKISARIAGRIAEVRFNEGDRVRKGQTLLILESPEAARARTRFIATISKVATVERNAKRIRELVNLKLAAEQEAINAESELKIQQAELKAENGNLLALGIPKPEINQETELKDSNENSGRIEVKSPLDGIVLAREVVRGSQVEATTNLAIIGNLDSVWFMVKLFEKDLGKVAVSDLAKVKLNSYPMEEFEGRLLYIGNQIDPNSRTVTGRIVIPNKNHLAKIGLFGTAELFTSDYEVLSVPLEAIASINETDYVFIEEKPGEYKARKVKLGRKNNSQVEILSGVTNSEYIVDKGIFTLKSKILKSTFGE